MTAPVADDLYARQAHRYPAEIRTGLALATTSSAGNRFASRLMALGAAAAGVDRVLSDDPDARADHGSILTADLAESMDRMGAPTTVEALDLETPGPAARQFEPVRHPWAAVTCNDTLQAAGDLKTLDAVAPGCRVLLWATGAGGFWVARMPDARTALEVVRSLPPRVCAGGVAPEFEVSVAGVVVDEILARHGRDDPLDRPRLTAFYSLARARRVTVNEGESPADLVGEITRDDIPPRVSFARHRIIVVGCGGLGCAFAPIPVLEGAEVTFVDDDRVERSNTNRQLWLAGHEGEPKAEVLAAVMNASTARAVHCRGRVRRVEHAADLPELPQAHALASLVDSQEARAALDTMCRHTGKVIHATAASEGTYAHQVIAPPHRACLRCTLGPRTGGGGSTATPCAAQADQVFGVNFAIAGVMASELRTALTRHGDAPVNLRFWGDSPLEDGNRFTRMLTNPPCDHVRREGGAHDA